MIYFIITYLYSLLTQLCYYLSDFLLNTLKYFGRHRIIKDREDNEPYLERYYLFLKDRQDFPFNVFLHKFLKSDPDDLHDHPWSYSTFILCGGYWEYTPEGKFWRGPLSFIHRESTSLHRIELEPSVGNCWTLFCPGKRSRKWGFKTKDGWVDHEKYLENKKKNI